jgi:ubiquinol-cytochrome c reductase cytochrome b subunit
MIIRRLVRWIDDRVGGARAARTGVDKAFPDHFSFMLGEIALYAFVVLVVTGVFLTLFFEPSQRTVVYDGDYAPLQGRPMSAAYRSVIRLSFDVRGGLVMRQMHHWAALVFVAAIVTHLGRIFFTGAFRKPREINWVIGVTLLILAIANGFAGYSLLDDLLSGTGLRIAYSLAESIPIIGTWIAFLAFGGLFPGDIIPRLFVVHVLIVPVAIATLIAVHLGLVWRQKHTQFAGPGRTEQNVIGSRFWPTYTAKSISLLFAIFAVIAVLGGLFQINPIWLYGPYEPAAVTIASQPDWYMGWLEGGLRIMPPWEIRALGYQIPNPFFPGVLLPTVTFALLYAYPFLEERVTHDHGNHHLLDRPRDRPVRTAIGVAALTFYGALTIGGASDVLARKLDISVNAMIWTLRTVVIVLPPIVGVLTWRACKDLQARRPPRPAVPRPREPAPVDEHAAEPEAELEPR